MSDYDNTNRGSLFRNDRRETDRHPEYKGSINVNGEEYWLSAWVKEAGPNAKNPGQKFFSLSVQPKNQAQTPQNGAQGARPSHGATSGRGQVPTAQAGSQGASGAPFNDDLGDIPF